MDGKEEGEMAVWGKESWRSGWLDENDDDGWS
jgi:hypothetical protein